jgi:threonine dehydratase
MIEKAAVYNNIKHYFLIEFKQVPGQLIKFTNDVLVDNIDITRFEYLKKTNRDTGTVLVGIELDFSEQIEAVMDNLKKHNYNYRKIDENNLLYSYLI